MNPEVARLFAAMVWLFVVCAIAAVTLLYLDRRR